MIDHQSACVHASYATTTMCALMASVCPALALNTFAGFSGNWAGSGSVLMSDGSRESIRCRAEYIQSMHEDALRIHVTCASDSYRVNIVADVSARGETISGSWQETTRQIQGEVSGNIPRPGQMQASLASFGSGIQLDATATGKRQAITIRSQGTKVVGADITLARR